MRLKNKICTVTGAAQGIGAATARFAAPGFVETPMLATNPDKVLAQMQVQASAYAFLASDDTSDINGAVIEVSGGMTV